MSSMGALRMLNSLLPYLHVPGFQPEKQQQTSAAHSRVSLDPSKDGCLLLPLALQWTYISSTRQSPYRMRRVLPTSNTPTALHRNTGSPLTRSSGPVCQPTTNPVSYNYIVSCRHTIVSSSGHHPKLPGTASRRHKHIQSTTSNFTMIARFPVNDPFNLNLPALRQCRLHGWIE